MILLNNFLLKVEVMPALQWQQDVPFDTVVWEYWTKISYHSLGSFMTLTCEPGNSGSRYPCIYRYVGGTVQSRHSDASYCEIIVVHPSPRVMDLLQDLRMHIFNI